MIMSLFESSSIKSFKLKQPIKAKSKIVLIELGIVNEDIFSQ